MNVKPIFIHVSIACNIIFLVMAAVAAVHYQIPAKIMKKYFGIRNIWPQKHVRLVMTGDFLIGSKWNELLSRNDILYIGNRGGSIDQIGLRVGDIVKANPDTVIVTANGFDVYMGSEPEIVAAKYQHFIESLMNENIRVVVQSALMGVPDKFDLTDYAAKVGLMNRLLKAYCETKNLVFIEVNDILSDGYHYKTGYSGRKGVSPNAVAYELWAQKLRNVLAGING